MMNPDPLSWPSILDPAIWDLQVELLPLLEQIAPDLLNCLGLRLADVLKETSDETLALAIKKNFLWEAAFVSLFVDRYAPYLIRWFRRWGASYHEAEDYFSELVIKFLRNRLAPYDVTLNFRSYLYRAAKNLWTDAHLRKRKGRPQPLTLDAIAEPADGSNPELEALGHELAQRLAAALSSLPPDQRLVFEAIMAGENAKDIASRLGCTVRAVFLKLFRARRKLEGLLGVNDGA
jgi:RNA polymerase sigma factor (sigma-70 family)